MPVQPMQFAQEALCDGESRTDRFWQMRQGLASLRSVIDLLCGGCDGAVLLHAIRITPQEGISNFGVLLETTELTRLRLVIEQIHGYGYVVSVAEQVIDAEH